MAVTLITQGQHRFFSGSMPSSVLATTCFATTREEDQETGFQRTLNKGRAQEIADYIDSGFGTIPTSIILSAQEQAGLTYDSRAKTVRFNLIPSAFKIIDGQHRIWGFKMARTNLRVPVVIYNSLTVHDEARLFVDINTKQKPVPRELVLDIQRLAREKESVQTLLNDIFDIFDTASDSPLFGRTTPYKRKPDSVSRVTFSAAVKPIIDYFEDRSASRIYSALASYLNAAQDRLTNCTEPIELSRPVIFRAFMQAYPELLQRFVDKYGGNGTTDDWFTILSGVENLKPTVFSTRNIGNASKAIIAATKPKLRL